MFGCWWWVCVGREREKTGREREENVLGDDRKEEIQEIKNPSPLGDYTEGAILLSNTVRARII
jgi:hypothetical protein